MVDTMKVFGTRRTRANMPEPIYTGPDVPVSYDPNWQMFTNLTTDQIAWFQAQPEWKSFVATQPDARNFGQTDAGHSTNNPIVPVVGGKIQTSIR